MSEPDQPRYLAAYEGIREDYREDVLERAADQLMSEGFPASVFLASHLLVGAYVERRGDERVLGEPRDPDQLHAIRGINLTQTRAGELAVRLGEVIDEVAFPEERKPIKEEPHLDASNNFSILLSQMRNIPPMTGERLESVITRLEAGRKAETELQQRQAEGTRSHKATVQRLRDEVAGRQKAIGELAESYLPFGIKVARQLRGRGLELGDLVSSAAENLLYLAARWEPSKGNFYTYAKVGLPRLIRRDIANTGRTIRLPIHIQTDIGVLYGAEGALAQKGIEATDEATAVEAGWEVEKVREVRETRRNLPLTGSLIIRDETQLLPEEKDDNDFRDTGSREYHPPAVYDDEMADLEVALARKAIDTVLETLPERERKIIRLRFGLEDPSLEPMTQGRIGKVLGLTGGRVGQLEQRAMHILRHPSKTSHLRGYFDLSETVDD